MQLPDNVQVQFMFDGLSLKEDPWPFPGKNVDNGYLHQSRGIELMSGNNLAVNVVLIPGFDFEDSQFVKFILSIDGRMRASQVLAAKWQDGIENNVVCKSLRVTFQLTGFAFEMAGHNYSSRNAGGKGTCLSI